MIKFVVLTNQRSGSKLLRSYLNSHSNICIGGEIFLKDGNKNVEKLNKLYCLRKKAVGFILHYNQVKKWMLEYFKDNDIKIIQLIRSDWVRFGSLFRGHYMVINDNPLQIKVNVFGVKKYIKSVKRNIKKYKDIVDYKIRYKEICPVNDEWKAGSRKDLLKFLGVKDMVLRTKTPVQHKFKLKDVVINYDLLKRFINE